MIKTVIKKINSIKSKLSYSTANTNADIALLPPPPTWSRILIWTIGSGASFLLIWSMIVKVDERVVFTGEITTSSPTVVVAVEDSGVIKQIFTKPHQAIKKNELILIFEDDQTNPRLESILQRKALLNLRQATDSNLYNLKEKELTEQVDLDANLLQRMETLLAVGAIEKTQILKQRSKLNRGNIQLTSLDEERKKSQFEIEQTLEELNVSEKELKAKLSRFQVRSPVDGFIQEMTYQTRGERIQNREVVAKIIPNRDLIARINIPSKLQGPVDVNSPATVSVDAFPVGEYGSIEAVIDSVSPMTIERNNSNSVSKTYNADLRLIQANNPELLNLDDLRPGMFVSAQIVLRDKPIITTIFNVLDKIFDPLTEQR